MSEQRSASETTTVARGPWYLAAAGVVLFHLAWHFQGDERGYWLPGLGLGIALCSWLGCWILPVLGLDLLLVGWWTHPQLGLATIIADALLHTLLIGASWWLYHEVAHGSRWLDDPRSATTFLILVPGGLAALTAALQASYHVEPHMRWMQTAAEYWLSCMVGILVVVPFLIVTCTPLLLRYRLLDIEQPRAFFGERDAGVSGLGNQIELVGLTFTTMTLALLLLWAHIQNLDAKWVLWASCLVLIVWTCIRQGLVGGCFTAAVTSMLVLAEVRLLPRMLDVPPEVQASIKSGIQGNLLAFCSSALLVGVSASWIRANETRFRHVVSRIPFVVYSARLPYGISQPGPDNPHDKQIGPSISKLANVLLVSPACQAVLGCNEEELLGPFERWLDRIVPEDRELVIASLTQLCLQKQPVTCEYRLHKPEVAANHKPAPTKFAPAATHRWLRDTLAPHYSEDGLVDGWEGLVEDVTDQRTLSQNLRKMTNMLQVLVTNLPTGVYFVQAPQGFPLLVNARARQLLGQREDLSAGSATLSKVFRLHRPDGTEYPWEELPVYKALRQGITCRANDIVVHRADGRKIPLITWAAPVDLNNTGTPDAAVWVLEDWSAMQQAEMALRESELRLRAIIETMGEGVIVQDDSGVNIDCNAAACAILGVIRERIIGFTGMVPDLVCLREDGSILPKDDHPDQQALRNHQPMRGVIVGLKLPNAVRWLLVNALPLPVGAAVGLNPQRARVVTTFADITEQMDAQDSLRLTRDKYQNLIETLPFMLLQRDRDFNITYLNPVATQLTGYSTQDLLKPGFCESIMHPDDVPAYHAAAQAIALGKTTRLEVRLHAKDGSWKNVMAFLHPTLHHGEVIGSTSMVVDVTTQRRLEQELQHARHLEVVGRLASGIVHDFNNLLMVLMGLAGCAKSVLTAEHPAWQHLLRIEDVGQQAGHLAGQLLTFSKERPRQRQLVDMNALVTQTLKLARSVIGGEITIETQLDDALPTVVGDENQLRQVMMNLCLNARDAMGAGGTLTVRTDRAAPANADGKAWIHVAIQDTGTGMPEDIRTRVFEPFFSTKERGTGLGLAVVQQSIQEAGGVIDVWSEPGTGTRFDVWLPIQG